MAYRPFLYKKMVGPASPDADSGDMVAVYDPKGERFGSGFYNSHSQIALRMLTFDDRPVDQEFFRAALERAVSLRLDTLRLQEVTNAYRVVHAEGDGLSGFIVDRYADVLSVQVASYGVYQQLGSWLPILEELLGTEQRVVAVDPGIAKAEGFRPPKDLFDSNVRPVRVEEHGIRYAVDFALGHKTGFFCDQRDNRSRLAKLVEGRDVLDLCCYTGGFALAAKVLGGARDVTGVDLDEKAIAGAKKNANLNQTRVRWVHSDAFIYVRQMLENGRQWDVVVVDPPKFIPSRGDVEEGRRKYFDLNKLAMALVKPGGLMVTCSCSGLLSGRDHETIVVDAARRQKRTLQFLDRTGAGADHPVMANCPESRYLKVLWTRLVR